MRIRMNTTKCGPNVNENWNEGEIKDVSVEEARAYVTSHLATALEPFEVAVVQPPEKAVITSPEKAVSGPAEIAGQGKGPVAAQKSSVGQPASPVAAPGAPVAAPATGNLTQPPTWGKK